MYERVCVFARNKVDNLASLFCSEGLLEIDVTDHVCYMCVLTQLPDIYACLVTHFLHILFSISIVSSRQ